MSVTVTWTPEAVRMLQHLVKKPQLTYEEIASIMRDELGMPINKNMCIGKARRLQIADREPKEKVPYVRKKYQTRPRENYTLPKNRPPRRRPYKGGYTITQIGYGDCKFIIDDAERPPYIYCGEATGGSGSYCPDHYKRVYVSAKKNWK